MLRLICLTLVLIGCIQTAFGSGNISIEFAIEDERGKSLPPIPHKPEDSDLPTYTGEFLSFRKYSGHENTGKSTLMYQQYGKSQTWECYWDFVCFCQKNPRRISDYELQSIKYLNMIPQYDVDKQRIVITGLTFEKIKEDRLIDCDFLLSEYKNGWLQQDFLQYCFKLTALTRHVYSGSAFRPGYTQFEDHEFTILIDFRQLVEVKTTADEIILLSDAFASKTPLTAMSLRENQDIVLYAEILEATYDGPRYCQERY